MLFCNNTFSCNLCSTPLYWDLYDNIRQYLYPFIGIYTTIYGITFHPFIGIYTTIYGNAYMYTSLLGFIRQYMTIPTPLYRDLYAIIRQYLTPLYWDLYAIIRQYLIPLYLDLFDNIRHYLHLFIGIYTTI